MASSSSRSLRVAVEGCGHGTLHAIYDSVTESCQEKGWSGVDLLIIGGDFQAVRNAADLNAMAVPVRYRELGDFHEYYAGTVSAPYLTIFIGGNHEASNYMRELYYGGWAAPNIYYLGAANVIRLGPIRIAGMSGIWKGYDYQSTHFERLPYNEDDIRSIFHTRELDVRKLLQIRTQVDVGVSHDWPAGIEWLGDHAHLFRRKSFFEQDARAGLLGSKAAKFVLDHLRPSYWFSAHLHVQYAALVEHINLRDQEVKGQLPENSSAFVSAVINEDEIDLGDEVEMPSSATKLLKAPLQTGCADELLRAELPESFRKATTPPRQLDPPTSISNLETRFLALDKCLPRRHFLQLLEITSKDEKTSWPTAEKLRLCYDPEWLAITKVFANDITFGDIDARCARDLGKAHYFPLIDEAQAWVVEHIVEKGNLEIPENFTPTAPVHDPIDSISAPPQPREYSNPQTENFCRMLDIQNPFHITEEEAQRRMHISPRPAKEKFRTAGGRGRFKETQRGHRGLGRGGNIRAGFRGRGP